jgi:GAF domain-containing protein
MAEARGTGGELDALKQELAAERSRLTALWDAERARASEARSEAARLNQELEEVRRQPAAPVSAQSDPTQSDPAQFDPAQSDPAGRSARRWTPSAQRALVAALVAASDLRAGLKDAIKVLGSVGGWDAITAWSPGDRGVLRCAAMWIESESLGPFETMTWQRAEPGDDTEIGRALVGKHAVVLADLESIQDRRLQSAVGAGMRSALLVPIRDGAQPIALLEFLSREPEAPDSDLAVSMEAIGLQLGHFAHLLRLGGKAQGRFGRV